MLSPRLFRCSLFQSLNIWGLLGWEPIVNLGNLLLGSKDFIPEQDTGLFLRLRLHTVLCEALPQGPHHHVQRAHLDDLPIDVPFVHGVLCAWELVFTLLDPDPRPPHHSLRFHEASGHIPVQRQESFAGSLEGVRGHLGCFTGNRLLQEGALPLDLPLQVAEGADLVIVELELLPGGGLHQEETSAGCVGPGLQLLDDPEFHVGGDGLGRVVVEEYLLVRREEDGPPELEISGPSYKWLLYAFCHSGFRGLL